MFCTACVRARIWTGRNCPAHDPAVTHSRGPLAGVVSTPSAGTVDGQPRRPGHRLTDGDARQLLDDDITQYGEVAS